MCKIFCRQNFCVWKSSPVKNFLCKSSVCKSFFPASSMSTLRGSYRPLFTCKFSHRIALVTCPSVFRLQIAEARAKTEVAVPGAASLRGHVHACAGSSKTCSAVLGCGIWPVNFCMKRFLRHAHVQFDCAGSCNTRA